jgi:hypothetical protein
MNFLELKFDRLVIKEDIKIVRECEKEKKVINKNMKNIIKRMGGIKIFYFVIV